MNSFKYMMTLVFLFFISVLKAEISSIEHLQAFREASKDIPKNSLVIFDIDRTLLIMEDCALKPGKKAFLEKLDKIAKAHGCVLDQNAKNLLLSKAMLGTTNRLVEPGVIDLINNLKERQIKVMALTGGTATGRLGDIASMEKWRKATLEKAGIDFSTSFPSYPELRFFEEEVAPAVFYAGILNASLVPKGKALIAFLEAVSLKPDLVLMIDDQLETLKSVDSSLQAKGIPFKGYQYNYVENALKQQPPCPYESAQILHLIKCHEWLQDDKMTAK